MLAVSCQTKPVADTGLNAGGADIAGSSVVAGTQQDLEANVGDRVFFDFDKSLITPEGEATLTRQAAWMKQNPAVNLEIQGHSDERGTREYNLALGERRANAARTFLESAGVESARLKTVSFGKDKPAVEGTGEEVWSQNRRSVSVVVTN
jgi:peptidoglycan-associated lipoprotein